MLFFLFLLLPETHPATFQVKTHFEPPEYELEYPCSMDIHPDHGLYVLDQRATRVLHWNLEGEYVNAFGREGQGPGEMVRPHRIAVAEDRVWVWSLDQKMTVFDTEGHFLNSISLPGMSPRSFAILNPNLAFLNTREISQSRKIQLSFYLVQLDPLQKSKYKSFISEAFLTPINAKNKNHTTMKAFAPDVDVQRDAKGNWYFGFSQNNLIYPISSSGETGRPLAFDIPTGPPTAEDRSYIENLSFPSPIGGRLSLKDFPNFTINYDHDKAFYTHFIIDGDRIVFALTPIGSLSDLNNGHARASYHVFNMVGGERLASGAYHLPEDSVVFYRNGQVLACILDEEGQFQVKQILLKGMHGWQRSLEPLVQKGED